MINSNTKELLKQLLPINNQMIIQNTMTGADEFKSLLFKANIGAIDDIPEEVGIFDTANFLAAMDLLEDATVTLKNKMLTATDGDTTLQFLTSDVSSLDDVQVDVKKIDTTVAVPSTLEFMFTDEIVKKVKKASAVFKTFDTLWVINENRTTEIKLGTKNSFSKSNNAFSIKLDTTLNLGKEFSIALPIDSILKVPSMEYTFCVKYNEKRDAYRVTLENELLTFVMSLQDS